MTRAQMAVVVAKRFNLPIVKPVVPTFIDVPTTHYAYAYIEAITKAGLLAGCANTPTKKFCPEVGTTRSQMAVPLALSHGYNGWPSKLPSFTDVPTTYYAYGHIEYVKSKNLMAGCSTVPSKFCPDTALTRIDATTALSNSLQIYGF
jgi:hypothetical protein